MTYEEVKAHVRVTGGFNKTEETIEGIGPHMYRVFRQSGTYRVFVHPNGQPAGTPIAGRRTKREAYEALVQVINEEGWA